jgi:protein involved in polysaccharide export with SLBB domain
MLSIFHRRTVLAALFFVLAACQPHVVSAPGASSSATVTATPAPLRFLGSEYHAGAGDVLKVTVYGEPDLSGEFIIGPDGKIALPLIGAVPVAGQTLEMIPLTIAAAYRDGYLVDPKVSVELKGAR